MTFKYIIAFLIIMAIILPSSAIVNLTYPDEYYNLYNMNTRFSNERHIINEYGQNYDLHWHDSINAFSSLATFRELRRQTILMEKQNELLAEQNTLFQAYLTQSGYSLPGPSPTDYYPITIQPTPTNTMYYYSPTPLPEGCYEDNTGYDPNDLVMHMVCPK